MFSRNTREIELSLSKSNLEAAVMQFVSSMGFKHSTETIESVSFDTKILKSNKDDVIPIKVRVSSSSYDDVMEKVIKKNGNER